MKRKTYFETVKERLIEAAAYTNHCAKNKDVNRNRVAYGEARTWCRVLRDLGHKVETPNIGGAKGYVIFTLIEIDGEKISCESTGTANEQ